MVRNNVRPRLSATILSLWLVCSPALVAGRAEAAQPICDEDDPTACVVPVRRGEPAPFDGQLLTPIKAARVAVEAASWPARVELEVARTASTAAAQAAFLEKLRVIDVRSLTRENTALREDRDFWKGEAGRREEPRAWYEHPIVVSGVTAAVVFGLLFTAIQVVQPRS